MPGESSTHRTRIFAVVVLYKQRPSASATVATLARALENARADCAVLVYDNSAESSAGKGLEQAAAAETMPAGFRYQAAAANHGLLGAYEAALETVRAEGYDWLLTLDQDTVLPEDFFSAIEPGLRAAEENPRIAAIVPHLAEGERLLSPAYVGLCRTTPMPASFAGVPAREPRAFNSAALLRVAALKEIGGFDPCFWLDHLDSWLHHQLYMHGWRMYVLDSVHLEHQLSLLNYRDRVSLTRLRNFLGAESAYFDLYGSRLAGAAYTVQLAGRLVKQTLRRETREVRRATWNALWRRLSVPKSKRVAAWRGAMGGLPGRDAGGESLMPQPEMPRQGAIAPLRALAVVVLYRTMPDASKTLTGLARAFAEDASLAKQLDVLAWDNSPAALEERSLPFPFTYQHAVANEGVSAAYNAAAVVAEQRGCAWLLLLDDDTSVTAEFLRGMLGHAAQIAEDARIAAVAPFLYAGTFCMSPRLWRFARHVPLPRPAHPYTETRSIFAANSGTLMRVRALEAIGGYNARFWLDFSDIDVFHRLHRQGFSVRIAGDLRLEHEMAMLDYDRRMTPTRFATFLGAESDFMDLYRGPLERGMHLLRLMARVVHQRSYADPAFARLSWRALRERLTTRRATRLAGHAWMRSAGADRG